MGMAVANDNVYSDGANTRHTTTGFSASIYKSGLGYGTVVSWMAIGH